MDTDIQKPTFIANASVRKSLLNTLDINIRKSVTFAVEGPECLCL